MELKIGNLILPSNVIVAPLAGYTNKVYREIMHNAKAGMVCCEMVSAKGLLYENKKTIEMLEVGDEGICSMQLFGSDASELAKAAMILDKETKCDIIDINMGCPVRKVIATGAGSALLKDPKKLEEMFKVICKHSPIPVTAKIRLGWNEQTINFKENIKALENAGIAAIGLHARTTRAGYAGKPRWDLCKNLRDEMSVPLIVSGDIYDISDAKKALEITHADAIMVARGGVGNPKLIERLHYYFEGKGELPYQTKKESKENLLKFANMLIEEKGEYSAMMVLRGIAPKFFLNQPDTKKLRSKLASALTTKESLIRILDEIEEEK